MMKKFLFVAALAAFALSAAEITVYRKGKEAWIQSHFSATHDIVIGIWLEANERAYLVPKGSDIRQAAKGFLLHMNSDEYAATSFGSYGFLSGNHGSAFARLVTAQNHGFTMNDSGKIITDEKGNKYVFVRPLNKDKFVMHPLNRAKKPVIGRPSFPRHSKEKLFFNDKEIKFTASVLAQLRPLNLMKRNEFLVDGKTVLPEGKVVKCQFLDHIFEHDVIAPEAAAEYIRQKSNAATGKFFVTSLKVFYPEKEPEFADYAKLPIIMKVKNRMRYQDNGAMVNNRTCTYPVSLTSVSQLEVMFGWTGQIARGNYQMFYIPKTKPVEQTLRSNPKKKVIMDFVKGINIAGKFDLSDRVNQKAALDPANPPDRFIRVTGKASPEYGIVVGYSLISGITALENKSLHRKTYYHNWYTKKMYPYAYQLVHNKPGFSVNTVSYKQYFAPQNEPDATAFYYHKQGKDTVVYFETHKALKNKVLNLPADFAGKKFSVIEKTPSVTLQTKGTVPAGGIKFNVKAPYGHLVLKITD